MIHMAIKPKIVQIIVDKVEIRKAEKGIYNPAPSSFELTHKMKKGVRLYVEGVTSKGTSVHFFTDQTIIEKSFGMDNYEKLLENPGNFFVKIQGEITKYDPDKDSDKIMTLATFDTSEIVPNVKSNDIITVSYQEKEEIYESERLKSVILIPQY